MKVAINNTYGGFGLSQKAYEWFRDNSPEYGQYVIEDPDCPGRLRFAPKCAPGRSDPELIRCIEELGVKAASGDYCILKIVEIPDDVDWCIEEYDGAETVHERHREWG